MNYKKTIFIDLLKSKGYTPKGYGYTKVIGENTHWVTLYDNSIQMYGYFTEDPEFEKDYDSGMVSPTIDQLSTLIDVIVK